MLDNFRTLSEKKVLITGNTGFKGSWLSRILLLNNANVLGYSLPPSTEPNLFSILKLNKEFETIYGDIRDFDKLNKCLHEFQPDYVIHLAAQPLVRLSYQCPRETYETNVMGSVNILEALRNTSSVISFLNVTTDKVYKNREWEWGYRESEELDGYDPYSNSKSCSDLITQSYERSFLKDLCNISIARAGNVLGGGDFSADRIIPDCFRSIQESKDIFVRNPLSIRPYQHVLEPLFAYLLIVIQQGSDHEFSGIYNIGPDESDCITTGELVSKFCSYWGNGIKWFTKDTRNQPHEASFLKLDCSRFSHKFSWHPVWNISDCLKHVVDWYKCYLTHEKIIDLTDSEIIEFGNRFFNR